MKKKNCLFRIDKFMLWCIIWTIVAFSNIFINNTMFSLIIAIVNFTDSIIILYRTIKL